MLASRILWISRPLECEAESISILDHAIDRVALEQVFGCRLCLPVNIFQRCQRLFPVRFFVDLMANEIVVHAIRSLFSELDLLLPEEAAPLFTCIGRVQNQLVQVLSARRFSIAVDALLFLDHSARASS